MLSLCSRPLALFIFVALAANVTVSLAQNAPGSADITQALKVLLPAYWSIESVDIRASINDGDDVTPRYRQRFVAQVLPNEDLYALGPGDQELGPFKVVITTRPAKQVSKLYGIASSSLTREQWVTNVVLESSVEALGQPASLFSTPIIVPGSTDAERVAAQLLATQELLKTVAEGRARAKATTEALTELAAQERGALEAANQQRLDALRIRYERESDVLKASAKRERAVLEEANRQRLEKLVQNLAEESSLIEEMDKTAARERNRLVEENRRGLEALKAKYEKEQAAAVAAAETLQTIAESKAEIAALEELSAIQDTLTQTRQRVNEKRKVLLSEQIETRKQHYEELTKALKSKDAGVRMAALEAVMASDDVSLKSAAIREAITSDDSKLQSKGLAAWISQKPHFSIAAKGSKRSGLMVFEITSHAKDFKFSGHFKHSQWMDAVNKDPPNNGSGFVSGVQITLSGEFLGMYSNKFSCTTTLSLDKKGGLTGKLHCGRIKYDVTSSIL